MKKFVSQLIVATIASVYGLLVSCYLLISMVKNGSKYFYIKRRDVPPDCLQDPDLGTHHYVQLKQIRMHYVSKGDPLTAKQTLLFIHGFPEFWYSWRHQIREFGGGGGGNNGDDYHVIAVDNRGYGQTDQPRGIHNYTIDKIVDDFRDLLTELRLRNVVLVAHDWGGAIGWGFALKYPELVSKLIIINSPHPMMYREARAQGWQQFFLSWYMFFFSLPKLPELALQSNDYYIFDYSFRKANGQPVLGPGDNLDAYKYTFHRSGFTGPLNWYRAMIWGYNTAVQPSNGYRVSTIPTLIIWGTKDSYLSPQLAAAHKYVDNLTVRYIDGCSHWTQMEEPLVVNKYIRDFIQ
ncbi:epoxide hydrolase 1-like [Oppia nitens]|uniref:epoxide hydrolase 1-like n=1 Tax=Oppia nitens TaxID=1686743 RepID=UPI0023DB904A|nr:epoxide hydrolase 1-like [Oppia nitens]